MSYVQGKALRSGDFQNKGSRTRQQPSLTLHLWNLPNPSILPIINHQGKGCHEPPTNVNHKVQEREISYTQSKGILLKSHLAWCQVSYHFMWQVYVHSKVVSDYCRTLVFKNRLLLKLSSMSTGFHFFCFEEFIPKLCLWSLLFCVTNQTHLQPHESKYKHAFQCQTALAY